MAKKQTRRSISVRGATYDQLRNYTASADLSMSDFIEQRIAEFFAAHPNAAKAPPVAPRIAVARPPAPAAPIRPVPARSTVTVKPAAAAPLRLAAPTPVTGARPGAAARTNEGRPKPTPAAQVVKARPAVADRGDYRAIRF